MVAHILKAIDSLVDVARRELVQLLVVTKDDDGDIDRAQDTKLVSFLEQSTFSLEKSAIER